MCAFCNLGETRAEQGSMKVCGYMILGYSVAHVDNIMLTLTLMASICENVWLVL